MSLPGYNVSGSNLNKVECKYNWDITRLSNWRVVI